MWVDLDVYQDRRLSVCNCLSHGIEILKAGDGEPLAAERTRHFRELWPLKLRDIGVEVDMTAELHEFGTITGIVHYKDDQIDTIADGRVELSDPSEHETSVAHYEE